MSGNNGDNNAKQHGNKKRPGGVTGKGFQPGQSGNPAGRPPTRGLLVHLRKQLEDAPKGGVSAEEIIAQKLVQLAKAGDLYAIREVFDRVEGRPKQSLDFNDITRQLQGRTDAELLAFATTGKWPEEKT